MTTHLLALSVGPVQEFIAAARRTRDLWFGSYLLSEISKAAAKAVHDCGGKLIFPAPPSDGDLAPDSAFNVANVIVAELNEADPSVVAQTAREAARSCWRSFAEPVFRDLRSVIQPDIWNDQVDDVIEFYSAWQVHSPQNYWADRAALMRLLAARKRCRDFLPARGRAKVPKSSLDGLRESVLLPQERWPERSRQRTRLRQGEQLDVVGLVKRVWAPEGGAPRYPSVARIAADPWLRSLESSRLGVLTETCRNLGGGALHEVDTSQNRGQPHYAAFPFEGTVLFRSRHRDLREEHEISDMQCEPLVRTLAELTHEYGEPSPYLGVLVADGDHIGQALSRLGSADDHKAFSKTLADFASEARQIVQSHNGVLVYAGGDDVLAFMPIDRCLPCSRALHDKFSEVLATWSTRTGAELTLSVGLAIAHFMEPLEDLLGYGRAAERHAKRPRPEDHEQRDRDGLAVHLLKRGGEPITVRANWSVEPDKHIRQLAKWIVSRAVTGSVAYELHKLADVYESWPSTTVKDAIRHNALSVIRGKQSQALSRISEIEGFIKARVDGADSLRHLASELLIARQLAVAIGQMSASPVWEKSL